MGKSAYADRTPDQVPQGEPGEGLQGPGPTRRPGLIRRTRTALAGAVSELLRRQNPEGFWCGELEGDSILQSEYILLKWIIGQEQDPRLPKIARHLRSQQRASDGAWIQYPGGKAHLSASVKAYLALKLMGDDPKAPHMAKARQVILDLGGAERCDTYSKFYLAALGELAYGNVPAVPAEITLAPRWFPFHPDKVSAWSRTMIMPLAILWHFKPVRKISASQGIEELFRNKKHRHHGVLELDWRNPVSWKNFFLAGDRVLKTLEALRLRPLRQMGLKRVHRWLIEHTEGSDGLGAIYPPMVYVIIAWRALGYAMDDPRVVEALAQLDRLMIEQDSTIRLQPCFSPIWDTALVLHSLAEAGLDNSHEALERGARWLVSKECRGPVGDWRKNLPPDVEPSGWFFEFNNAHFPDVDDSAMVVMGLRRTGGQESIAAAERGLRWMLAFQNEDGGWAAFDRTVHRPVLEAMPFADHNAIQDPSCPDITGRVLESLGYHGLGPDHPSVVKAIAFLQATQADDGAWFGRWGVNYIYGTWQVLVGLKEIGYDMNQSWVLRAGQWLKSVQKRSGAFGESADTYENPDLRGQGPATPSQTAWGLMGLLAVYGPRDRQVLRSIRWLCRHQEPSGSWHEKWFTGTGFPRVFYLRYHLYCLYFPLMALARWRRYLKCETVPSTVSH